MNTGKRLFRSGLATGWLLLGWLAAAGAEDVPPPAAPAGEATPLVRLVPPEMRVLVLAGNAQFNTTTVTATYQCFLCAPVTASESVSFADANVTGLRMEFWGPNQYAFAGVGIEVYGLTAKTSEVKASYTALMLMPMARVSALRSPTMPGGHLSFYGGAALAGLMTGEVSVAFPALPSTVRISNGLGLEGDGGGVFFGLSAQWPVAVIFVEHRRLSMNLSGAYWGDRVDAPVKSRQTVAGIGYRF